MNTSKSPRTLKELRRDAHDRACRARAVARALESPAFEEAFDRATEEGRAVAIGHAAALDKDALDAWIASARPDPGLAGMTLRELRLLGQKLGIRGYHQIPKALLLSEITHETQRGAPEATQATR